MELILENVRCFAGKHVIPIKPLTILIGENSSGKTSLLASLSAVCDPSGFPLEPKFNEPPYSLGNFDTIATYKGGRAGREKVFSLGYAESDDDKGKASRIVATYWGFRGQVNLLLLRITAASNDLTLSLSSAGPQEYKGRVAWKTKKGSESIEFSVDSTSLEGRKFRLDELLYYIHQDMRRSEHNQKRVSSFAEAFLEIPLILSPMKPALSIAPIRTKPRRTYDQVTESFNPEGDHIPFTLARLLGEEYTSKSGKSLVSALERFGRESGLFRRVTVKKLGTKPGDPFQVMISVSGRPANMLDVGYGISQALPVVVQSVLLAKERLLLLQQPEVHLHPRAQAALGSFFVDMVSQNDKRFVVETHSDYIVDRIRMEIAEGKLPRDSFLILYFERKATETTVYPITVDALGNILGAPPTYREFFLREEMNLLTRGG